MGKSKEGAELMSKGTHCRDIFGKLHDIKELRDRRHQAVLKGMRFMHRFLLKDKAHALMEVGDDAATLFFEIWYTSANTQIRCVAKSIARDILNKYEKVLVKNAYLDERTSTKKLREGPRQGNLDAIGTKPGPRDVFFELMFCAR